MHSHGMSFIGGVFPSPEVEGEGQYRAVQVHQQKSSQPRGPMGAESQPTLYLTTCTSWHRLHLPGVEGHLVQFTQTLSPAPLGPYAQVGEANIPHLSEDTLWWSSTKKSPARM